MPSAILRESFKTSAKVDAAEGVVRGCHLAEVGKKATYAGADGKPIELTITAALIDSLLAICHEDDRLPGHWTHSWTDGKNDALLSRVTTWRNFAKDGQGNLIADAFVWPGPHRDAILHAAENDPDGMMVSMVFDYTGGNENPIAQSVRAADFVARGAATTALCSAVLSALSVTQKQTAQMADSPFPPKAAAAPPAAPATPPAPAAPFSPDQVAAIQQMIQAALNPPQMDDSAMPAMMAHVNAKIVKAVDKRFSESETKVATLAEAAFTKQIGSSAVLKNFSDSTQSGDGVTRFMDAVTAQLTAGATNRGEAIRRVLKDKPELAKFRENI